MARWRWLANQHMEINEDIIVKAYNESRILKDWSKRSHKMFEMTRVQITTSLQPKHTTSLRMKWEQDVWDDKSSNNNFTTTKTHNLSKNEMRARCLRWQEFK